MPADILSAAVAVLAVLFIFYTGINVARMRGKHKVDAPATTGPLEFESAVRVQMNTLEQSVLFFPLLYVATAYFNTLAWLPAAFGLVWIIGRIVYLQGYMAAPNKRSTGFLITSLATAGLLILSVWGLVASWMATHAS
ncbi:MAG: MAPEG family protein [Alphaproteobacteria bacterium]|nr:MAPEG family protein [Alphaproteobacteria bacterium]MBL6939128.1 MAPEG family protein [Alphaproteobacteria bacterium]MBL7096645.1 MAPEG family protein [Alphaproteobacteria bacterium]